ncbi:MAG: hypothetical protein OXC57_10305 [Rhodobacteraceae bacterium]|nr:hypothetical protein [Paracoccaceae bacterium]
MFNRKSIYLLGDYWPEVPGKKKLEVKAPIKQYLIGRESIRPKAKAKQKEKNEVLLKEAELPGARTERIGIIDAIKTEFCPVHHSAFRGAWKGTLKGNFEGISISWRLAFVFRASGGQSLGEGHLCGSATCREHLPFEMANTSSGPREVGSILISVQESLPGNKNKFLNFILTDLVIPRPDRLEGTFHLVCMEPLNCNCRGAFGKFRAFKV